MPRGDVMPMATRSAPACYTPRETVWRYRVLALRLPTARQRS